LLKICDEKPIEDLQSQTRVLNYLKSQNYPTCYPYISNEGIYYCLTCNLKVIIYNFLQGVAGNAATLTKKQGSQIGTALAKLHKLTPLEDLPEYALGYPAMEAMISELKGSPLEKHPFLTTLTQQMEILAPYVKKPFASGMLHGDLFADNIMFDHNGDLLAVVDWEEICIGPLILDLAMTVIGCCYHPNSTHLNVEVFQEIAASYDRERKLPEEEKESFAAFIKFSLLSIAFWRFRQFNVKLPGHPSANKYQELIDRLLTFPDSFSIFSPLPSTNKPQATANSPHCAI